MADPAISQDDVGIQNLSCKRIDAARSNCRSDIVIQPSNEVIIYVFRILVHVCTGSSVLVVHFDCVRDSNFLEGLVPCKDSVFHPAAISNWRGVLDVEHDGFLRRTDCDFWIGLFKVPAVDEPHAGLSIAIFREVCVACRKEPDSLIRHSWLVAAGGSEFADGKVQLLELTCWPWNFECNFDIAFECLGRSDRKQSQSGRGSNASVATAAAGKQARRISEQHAVEVDDGAAGRANCHDWHVQQDSVCKQPLDRRSRFAVTNCSGADLWLNQCQSLVESTPIYIGVSILEPCVGVSTGLSHRQEIPLHRIRTRQFRVHLPVFLSHIQVVHWCDIGLCHDLRKSFQHLCVGGKLTGT